MAKEDWEIDVLELTLDDFEVLQACAGGIPADMPISQIKETLGRMVTNRTAEEIGKTPLRELNRQLERLNELVEELAVPKANDTPS